MPDVQAVEIPPVPADAVPISEIDGAFRVLHRWHVDDRGALREIWRESWGGSGDGRVRQVYATTTRPDVVKAWHYHRIQTDRFVVVAGAVRLVLVDTREGSATHGEIFEIVLDTRNPQVVVIPPGVMHGWINVGEVEAVVLNCVSREYAGDDEYRRGAHEGPDAGIPYEWLRRVDG